VESERKDEEESDEKAVGREGVGGLARGEGVGDGGGDEGGTEGFGVEAAEEESGKRRGEE